jgi:hypothetical protein
LSLGCRPFAIGNRLIASVSVFALPLRLGKALVGAEEKVASRVETAGGMGQAESRLRQG